MAQHIGNAVSVFLQIIMFLIGIYYLGIGFFSLFSAPMKKGDGKQARFAVIIPAHNEAEVLGSLLRSVKAQNYPSTHLAVFVAADRCTDRTEQVAAAYGATVLRQNHPHAFGKGAVLTDAFSKLLCAKERYDAFAVLDADNIADPDFFSEINETLQSGAAAVQGYIDTKNPNAGWIPHAYAVWYWISNRILQMGSERLGLGCSLGGTGFALSRKLLFEIPWQTHTLAEDAEYTAAMTLQNHRVAYAPHAVVYDEKPTSFSVSMRQRMRWAQGITQVQRDYGGALLRSGHLNGFLRLWSNFFMPLLFTLFLLLDVFAIRQLCHLRSASFVTFWTYPIPFLLLNLYLLGTLFSILFGLIRDRKWNVKILWNLFGFFAYLISWIPSGLLGAFRHTRNGWYHTVHKSK